MGRTGTKTRQDSNTKNKKYKHKWRKGQSCVTNPVAKTHRDAAKNRFFNINTGKSSLTVDAIAKHDATQTDLIHDELMSEKGVDLQSTGGKTFGTWATNWTECTNTTFNRVHRYWASDSALHKEILAVLAAVTEVIKTKGGNENETEYFAAFMTTLETVEGENSVAAAAYLLSLAIKRVPQNVLKTKFSDVSKVLLDVLSKHINTDTPALLRSVLQCVAHVLRVQPLLAWSHASTTQVFHSVLSFCTHPRPKVRKAAHTAVQAVLQGSVFMTQDDAPPHHPAAQHTAKYCLQEVEKCGGDATGALHILGLLKDVVSSFPPNSLKLTCETILRVMTLANVLVTSVAMKTLHGMFAAKPKATTLSADLNAQIITALYDYQPVETDGQPMTAWLSVMEKAHVNLAGLNVVLCVSHLPRLSAVALSCLQGSRSEVVLAASNTLIVLLRECVGPLAEQLGVIVSETPPGGSSAVHKLVSLLEGALSYQFHAAWKHSLHILTVMFEVLGKHCHSIMKKGLLSLADLRDSHAFPYRMEVDKAVGMATKTMGPRVIISTIPLQITGDDDDYDFPRSWLLPVLRDNIGDAELSFFTEYFLPLAAKLQHQSLEFGGMGGVVQAKTYDALQRQMWSLLPAFCKGATDIPTAFRGIAKILGSALKDRPDIQHDVLTGLRRLIQHAGNEGESHDAVAKFAKNFLPILLNIFIEETENESDPKRLAVLETLKVFLQIADSELSCALLDTCQEKISEPDCSSFRRHALMDVIMTMVTCIDLPRLKAIFAVIVEMFKSSDHTVQKKAYRVIEEICVGQSAACIALLPEVLPELQQHLLHALSSANPSAKAPRLRCLILIFQNLESPQTEFIQAVIPEAILCTKETAEKARSAAFRLLAEMGKGLLRWYPDNAPEKVGQYLRLVMAGLQGTAHMVTCTVLALTAVLFEFKGQVDSSLLTTLVENACILLMSKTRDIIKSALGLLKVIIAILDSASLAQHMRKIVDSLVLMKEESRRVFRFKVKDIFTRLIRKFGYEVIHGIVPPSQHKLLAHIHKTQERAKRLKEKNAAGAGDVSESEDDGESGGRNRMQTDSIDDLLRDTDSELEEDASNGKKAKGKKQKRANGTKGSAWLKEGGEDDFVDFMDPGVSKRVLATKPAGDGETKKGKLVHNFKKSKDGRLIIKEDSDEEKLPKKDAGTEKADLEDLLDTMEQRSGNMKRRKRPLVEGEDDEEGPASKYKAGGRGIHRPTEKKAKNSAKSEVTGGEYRAKKAGGDIKKKGKPDPYAYVPLQFKNLNKRKAAKVKGQFRSLVKGAKKGAQKGGKQHNRKK